jgi:hypothetical protein
MPVQVLVRIFMRTVMVLVVLMLDLSVNGPGICRGREIKDCESQKDEREKFFHNDSGFCAERYGTRDGM